MIDYYTYWAKRRVDYWKRRTRWIGPWYALIVGILGVLTMLWSSYFLIPQLLILGWGLFDIIMYSIAINKYSKIVDDKYEKVNKQCERVFKK